MHSSLLPSFRGILYPKIGYQDKYYKWTALAHYKKIPNGYQNDFDTTSNILKYAWSLTSKYFESYWSNFLKQSEFENTSSNIINPDSANFTNGTLVVNYFKSTQIIKGASDIFTEEEYSMINNINIVQEEIKSKKKHKQKKKKKNEK